MPKVTRRHAKSDPSTCQKWPGRCQKNYIAKVPLYLPGSFWHVDGPGSQSKQKKADASVLWFSLQFHTQIHTCQTVTLMFCVISQTLYFCSLGQHENVRTDHGHPCVTRILFAKFALIVVCILFVLYLFPKWTTKSTHVMVLHEHPQAVQTLSIHYSFPYVHIFIRWKWLSPFSCKYSHDTLRIWLVCDMCEPNIFECSSPFTKSSFGPVNLQRVCENHPSLERKACKRLTQVFWPNTTRHCCDGPRCRCLIITSNCNSFLSSWASCQNQVHQLGPPVLKAFFLRHRFDIVSITLINWSKNIPRSSVARSSDGLVNVAQVVPWSWGTETADTTCAFSGSISGSGKSIEIRLRMCGPSLFQLYMLVASLNTVVIICLLHGSAVDSAILRSHFCTATVQKWTVKVLFFYHGTARLSHF